MRFFKREKGSVLLETAIIFPVFLIFVFFLWTLIRISVMQMALDKATSEVAQTMAHYSYYGSILVDGADKMEAKLKSKTQEGVDNYADDLLGADSLSSDAVKKMVENLLGSFSITDLAAGGIGGAVGGENGSVSDPKIRKSFIESMAVNKSSQTKQYLGGGKLNIVKVEADVARSTSDPAYYTIEASYEVPLNLPFLHDKKIKLYSKSSRAMWTT